jgi:hypothetical protein
VRAKSVAPSMAQATDVQIKMKMMAMIFLVMISIDSVAKTLFQQIVNKFFVSQSSKPKKEKRAQAFLICLISDSMWLR